MGKINDFIVETVQGLFQLALALVALGLLITTFFALPVLAVTEILRQNWSVAFVYVALGLVSFYSFVSISRIVDMRQKYNNK